MKIVEVIKKIRLPLAIMGVGAVLSYLLVIARPEPQALERKRFGPMVNVMQAKVGSYPLRLSSTGVIQAKRQTTLSPQVAGRVVWIAEDLEQGAIVPEGRELFRIDPKDYEYKVKMAEFEFSQAVEEYEKVRSRARIAQKEWKLMRDIQGDLDVGAPGTKGLEKPNPLVLYKPQLATAKARLEATKASVEKAKLDLERTTLRAPFNARIISENAEVGKYFRIGDSALELVGTDVAEVVVSLPISELKWLIRDKKELELYEAEVVLNDGDNDYTYPASFSRILGDVDPRGRMNRIVVDVADPYLLSSSSQSALKPPLSVGSFVKVHVDAGSLDKVVELPRLALRENDSVWVMKPDNTLEVRTVKLLRLTRKHAYVESGIKDGERVVLTLISGAVNGMQLRPVERHEG